MPRLNPTIFDKLSAGQNFKTPSNVAAGRDDVADALGMPRVVEGFSEGKLRVNLDTFSENALRANIRRELNWLLNSTHLEATTDLSKYPQVRTSVLNYGVADLAGKSQSSETIKERATKIAAAIRTFEPRIDPSTLTVNTMTQRDGELMPTYVISGDITSATAGLSVRYLTDVEEDTGSTTVRE
jgi:type VI secretion system protein ImpF